MDEFRKALRRTGKEQRMSDIEEQINMIITVLEHGTRAILLLKDDIETIKARLDGRE